ncbi:hypothetical protein LZ32DRAFT_381626 [Colletotrichum eremochloae]|nr:hypothetical protein LZ32DRAFT_381626 [Colletotrichum eremochloae]
MAEALGLAASVFAVVDMTTKVGSASFKLMRLWNEVKEVPVMLREKAERIKDLEDFLDDAEIQMANNQLPKAVYNMARLQKHIAKARCALTDVQKMVDQLQAKVNPGQRGFKQRFASTKVLLRKDEWNALDKSLDSALYLLSIAQAQCVMAMTTACTAVLLEEQPRPSRIPGQSLIGNGHSFKTDEEKENSIERRKPNYAHSTVANVFHMPYSDSFLPTFRFGFGANSSFQFSILTPTWLSGSVYSILAQRSFQGWQLNLRAYEVMEFFPPELHEFAIEDDHLSFFRFLDENKITLHARDQFGKSLLEVAVIHGGFTTTKLLLERGLDRFISHPISPTVKSVHTIETQDND